MNDLKIFENHQFGEIRVIEQDGEPWFVAADVCRALGLEQITRAMDRLDDDEGGLVKVTHPQSPTKTMDVNAVNEPGLYHLVLCSNKPEAKAFKRWITHEVIPAIRRTGSYTVPNMSKCPKNCGPFSCWTIAPWSMSSGLPLWRKIWWSITASSAR